MSAGQNSGTGAMTELNDEKVRKDDILSNRDKAQRADGQSLDETGVQVDEYKDVPTNQRPEKSGEDDKTDAGKSDADKSAGNKAEADQSNSDDADEPVDRPGFDLGGTDNDTSAGKGLGLGKDAKEGRKDWGVR